MPIRTGWLNDADQSGRHWFAVAQDVDRVGGSAAVTQLLNQNFFEQFPSFSFADRATLWEWVGGRIAAEQDDGDGLGEKIVKGIAATVGFGVGGATGAAAASGNVKNVDDLKNYAALDVAGLGAGVTLGGIGAAGLTPGAIAKAGAAALAGLKALTKPTPPALIAPTRPSAPPYVIPGGGARNADPRYAASPLQSPGGIALLGIAAAIIAWRIAA